LAGASAIMSTDPAAETAAQLVGWITRGWVAPAPSDVASLRIVGLTMTPSLAGLILMFATTLAAPRTASR
jgi:hypothetical protein